MVQRHIDVQALSTLIQSSHATDGEPNGLVWDDSYQNDVVIRRSLGRRRGRGGSRGLKGRMGVMTLIGLSLLGLCSGRALVQFLFVFRLIKEDLY